MAGGDHIFVNRFGYTHHGIDAGDGAVIHYTGEVGQKSGAAIRCTPVDEFTKGCPIQIRRYAQGSPSEDVLKRARRRVGENRYNLASNNCEHFATWCKTGVHASEQVKDAAGVGGGTVASGSAVAAGLGAVSATGAVAGLSGSGIMSGLATIGGVVGAGAAAGIVAVGVLPATLSAGAMMYVLKDDPVLDPSEREARKSGRTATVASALSASAASIGAVATAGSVTGLSAAGITSGLAAVGSIVGGGMAAGVAVTAAAPAVAAAGLGYGAYRLVGYLRRRAAAKGIAK